MIAQAQEQQLADLVASRNKEQAEKEDKKLAERKAKEAAMKQMLDAQCSMKKGQKALNKEETAALARRIQDDHERFVQAEADKKATVKAKAKNHQSAVDKQIELRKKLLAVTGAQVLVK